MGAWRMAKIARVSTTYRVHVYRSKPVVIVRTSGGFTDAEASYSRERTYRVTDSSVGLGIVERPEGEDDGETLSAAR